MEYQPDSEGIGEFNDSHPSAKKQLADAMLGEAIGRAARDVALLEIAERQRQEVKLRDTQEALLNLLLCPQNLSWAQMIEAAGETLLAEHD